MAAQGEMHFQFRPQKRELSSPDNISKSVLIPQLVQCTDYDRDKCSLKRENADALKAS